MLEARDSLKCRLCDSERRSVILSHNSRDLGEKFSLIKCEECNFVSVEPLLTDRELSEYYDQDYWQDETGRKSILLNKLFKLRMLGVVRIIRRFVPRDGRILDWGCGDGSLLQLLDRCGFVCFGIDTYLNPVDDHRILDSTIDKVQFPNEYFDAITCFHVLEHIRDPLTSVRKAVELLKPGGVMVVEVPNIDSLGFQVFKEKWQPLEIPTHFNHFSPKTLKDLFKEDGKMEILKVESFSFRVSPSALVLSLFPSLSPRRIRKANAGKYPVVYMILYLLLQILACPFGLLESFLGRGAVIRMYIKKRG